MRVVISFRIPNICLRVSLTFILLASLGFGSTLSTANAAPLSTKIVGSTATAAPRISGNTIVWIGPKAEFLSAKNIYQASLSNLTPSIVVSTSIGLDQVDIDGSTLVWRQFSSCYKLCFGPVMGKNLQTGQEFRISPEEITWSPAISGDWVVYGTQYSKPGTISGKIMARNIRTMAPPIMLAEEHAGEYRFAIEGSRVLWVDKVGNPDALTQHWQLLTQLIGETSPTVLDEGNASNYLPEGWDLHGNLVVYVVDKKLRVLNLTTGERRMIAGPTNRPALNPTTDGHYVFWESEITDSTGNSSSDLWGFDLQSNSYFPVKVKQGSNTFPQFRNNTLTWLADYSRPGLAFLPDLLPTAPHPPSASTSEQYYFSQTGHTLAYGFKGFWDRNGGLPVFGFSRTEEFDQVNPDTGKVNTVQYFERQRYEYHSENKGTPYEVLLGRLGAAEATRLNLFTTAPFQAVTASAASNCQYFPETNHNLCSNFEGYWQSHGLDLGENGISFRESLALFGLPISEAFKDPQTGLTTQYFERAKFEYHPENKGTAYEVLLGLLGNQELKSRGWLQ